MNQDFQEMMLRIKSYISEFVNKYSVFDDSLKNYNFDNSCDSSKFNEFKNYTIDKIDFYLN